MTDKVKYKRIFLLITFVLIFYSVSKSEESIHSAMEDKPDDEGNCLFCHSELPKGKEKSPDYLLNFEPSEVCIACHSETEHVGSKKHLGYMNPQGSGLPGDENNKIACFSCHDPHPQGIIEGRVVYDADIGKRERDFINEVVIPEKEMDISIAEKTKVRLRHPLDNNKLCRSCHVKLN